MLYINYSLPGEGNKEGTFEWKVGEESPLSQLDESINVISVYADGDEKEYIVSRLNIPFTWGKGKPCIWRGEFARFIFDNL